MCWHSHSSDRGVGLFSMPLVVQQGTIKFWCLNFEFCIQYNKFFVYIYQFLTSNITLFLKLHQFFKISYFDYPLTEAIYSQVYPKITKQFKKNLKPRYVG